MLSGGEDGEKAFRESAQKRMTALARRVMQNEIERSRKIGAALNRTMQAAKKEHRDIGNQAWKTLTAEVRK